MVGAEAFDDAVALEHVAHVTADARESKRPALAMGEIGELADLFGTLGVDEVHAYEVDDDTGERVMPPPVNRPSMVALPEVETNPVDIAL